MTQLWLLPLAFAFAGAAAAAEPCETLRAQIEARIAAAGVTRFTVTAVDASTVAAGQVVGSCELGSKKIVYQREPATGAEAAAPRPGGDQILTECKNGRVSIGGDCPR
jgi:hypothetical protein